MPPRKAAMPEVSGRDCCCASTYTAFSPRVLAAAVSLHSNGVRRTYLSRKVTGVSPRQQLRKLDTLLNVCPLCRLTYETVVAIVRHLTKVSIAGGCVQSH